MSVTGSGGSGVTYHNPHLDILNRKFQPMEESLLLAIHPVVLADILI